ncbi:hypothetical protein BJ508DRAFT_143478 [Ascobolus immersus RN42]|uniref:Uncharacterized protein n=1 Tax=Ascobolus immersus RN42 TaxID=1160509 RepID=A0A3N4HZH7_ASCIM|nr:hypothetical protein BJ508DRAFT_143478 [Ascobolus immersus RN42]
MGSVRKSSPPSSASLSSTTATTTKHHLEPSLPLSLLLKQTNFTHLLHPATTPQPVTIFPPPLSPYNPTNPPREAYPSWIS